MSNVISFFECMGQDAALRHANGEDLQIVLASTQLEPQEQAAVLANDQTHLETLIGATRAACCGIMPGKDDEDEDDPGHDDDEIRLSVEAEAFSIA
jgi:hypothetical protein